MSSPFNALWMVYSRLPTKLRAGLGLVIIVAVLYSATYFVRAFFPGAGYIIIIGVVAVILILLGLRALLRWRGRRKGKGLGDDIEGHAAAAPQVVTKASHRARLDDLRKKFDEGVAKFRSAGKNLYSLPWYILVGEPASGKTEAIRHSNIGFPPGLQDPLQGAGGTINMNWWFTDRAVVLDTAGKLMFEEIQAAATTEWDEFLRLLKSYRPNCPLNGIVLVIPADTLITDTADAITRKAEQIAQQLHKIQRVLGKRFPIFVLITKCDRITGFREFFENVTDPRLTSQMLGWSNPAPLDDKFQPEQLERHLRVVRNRLRRRRLTLLADPVHTADPNARRVDEVDSLYAFPRSLGRITSRLQQYLTTVFAGGEWTGRPLFLRGIYFTSSMREGSPLDEGLAQALGVPVESLPDDRAWDREASYFLKDVFLAKMFKERNLVSGAVNVNQQLRRRKMLVTVFGIASVALLALFTWLGASALHKSVGIHRDYWVAAAASDNWDRRVVPRGGKKVRQPDYWKPIVKADFPAGNFAYDAGLLKVGSDEQKARTADFHDKLRELSQFPIKVPWIFVLARLTTTDLPDKRLRAQRLLFESSTLRPLVDAAREKIGLLKRTNQWPAGATEALAQLVRLENPKRELPDLDALFAFVLRRDDDQDKAAEQLSKYEEDKAATQRVLEWMYSDGGGEWPPAGLDVGPGQAHETILAGVDAFIAHLGAASQEKGKDELQDEVTRIQVLGRLLHRYDAAEKLVLRVDDEFLAAETVDASRSAGQWRSRLDDLAGAKEAIEEKLTRFAGHSAIRGHLDALARERVGRLTDGFNKFRKAIGIERSAQAAATDENRHWQALCRQVNRRLDERLRKLTAATEPGGLNDKDIQKLDLDFLRLILVDTRTFGRWKSLAQKRNPKWLKARGDAPKLRLSELRLMMYLLADGLLPDPKKWSPGDDVAQKKGLSDAVGVIRGRARNTQGEIDGVADLTLKGPKSHRDLAKDAQLCATAVTGRLARPQQVYLELKRRSAQIPRTVEQVGKSVEKLATEPVARPGIPLTAIKAGHFEARFDRRAMARMLRERRDAENELKGILEAERDMGAPQRGELEQTYQEHKTACAQFAGVDYFEYWSQKALALQVAETPDWQSFRRRIGEIAKGDDVADALKQTGKAVVAALSDDLVDAAADLAPDAAQRSALRAKFEKARTPVVASYSAITPSFAEKCGKVLREWQKLSEDPFEARKRLLSLPTNGEIKKAYFPFADVSAEARKQFANKYWISLTEQGLSLLVAGAHQKAQDSFKELTQKYARFPLVKAGSGRKPLTGDEINEARKLADRLVFIREEAPPKPGATALDKQLHRLLTFGLGTKDWMWVSQARALLDALEPEGEDKFLKCEIWLLKDQPTPAVVDRWVHVRAYQGDREIGKHGTGPGADRKLCEVRYPGDPLVLRFFEHTGQEDVKRTLALKGDWSVLRLVHPGEELDSTFRGSDWKIAWKPGWLGGKGPGGTEEGSRVVEMAIEDVALAGRTERTPRKIRFGLKFQKKLPKLEQWPARRDK